MCPSAVVRTRETAGRRRDRRGRAREAPPLVPSASSATRKRAVQWPSHVDALPWDAGHDAVTRRLGLVGVARHAGRVASCHGGVVTSERVRAGVARVKARGQRLGRRPRQFAGGDLEIVAGLSVRKAAAQLAFPALSCTGPDASYRPLERAGVNKEGPTRRLSGSSRDYQTLTVTQA
jgi:hypothetical protein